MSQDFAAKSGPVKGLLGPLTSAIYGMTTGQALEKNVCVVCKDPISDQNVRTAVEQREYRISAMCGCCWDKTFARGEEGEDDA